MKLKNLFIQQDPDSYTPENHEVWQALCRRQEAALCGKACSQFYRGLDQIKLDFQRLPRLSDINDRIAPITGWRAAAVPGYLDARYFFQCLRDRNYPTTIGIRSADSMDYVEEPDIFHDVFGHVALMADPAYGRLMQHFGDIHDAITTDQDLTEMTRLFWFTIEFGLIREGGETRLLGSGLLSSPGEAAHCLSDKVERRPFRLAEVIAQPFRIDVFQDVLFIAESLEQLLEAGRVLIYQINERNAIRWPKGK
ncbi:MAG: phenylalanine 4-monooxygenase [Planctomycetia bacterium]|jgi:phenylalanine-4-hydroxylase|nr:phenylalanine 4-monooxygenase [Planctomycetia bacterium]MCC7313411.1 phenylalanine 4-monooxygenase [Planctomycetota bacterium]OQZ05254.1 MAG: phenylalanine 4-monooxygenase [Planctomycetes bacterium UTPLA1]